MAAASLIDTNVLVYRFDPRFPEKQAIASVTALPTEVFLGAAARFADGKAVASYVGMIPIEYSNRS